MAGNSRRRGARRDPGSKKGATTGSGGQPRRALKGKGPTPKAEQRTGHPAQRRAAAAARRDTSRRSGAEAPELLIGRNPVAEAMRTGVPATALYVALGIEMDDRVADAIRLAGDRGLPIVEVGRGELDRMTGAALHQGIGVQVPAYDYAHPDDLLAAARESADPPLLLALDGITDPRNLGAALRSAAAFGAHGVVVPQRRSVGMTATAWRTSAGAAARLPVARATNLARTLGSFGDAGLVLVGLSPNARVSLDDLGFVDGLDVATDPLVLVVGSEGRGLSRLVGQACTFQVSIPMSAATESLNASVAAAVALAEVARLRRARRARRSQDSPDW